MLSNDVYTLKKLEATEAILGNLYSKNILCDGNTKNHVTDTDLHCESKYF